MKLFYLIGLACMFHICPSIIAQTYINFSFNQDPDVTANAGASAIICDGEFANLNGNASGGDGSYTYLWTPSADVIGPSSATTTANPSSTTLYTFSVTDGNNCSKTDTMVVTLPSTPLSVDAGSPSTICMGNNVILTATPGGGYGGNTYDWSPGNIFSDSTSINPTVTPGSTVTCFITVTDAEQCSATDSVTITVIDCSGIEDESNAGTMQVYPNPSNGIFTLLLDQLNANDLYDIKIFNVAGSIVYQKEYPGNGSFPVDLSSLAAGMYTLTLYHSGVASFSHKIVIQ